MKVEGSLESCTENPVPRFTRSDQDQRGSPETSLHLLSEFNQLEGANKLPLNPDVQFSKAVMLFPSNDADRISPEWPLQRGIFPTFSPDYLFQNKSPPQQDTGWRLPGTAVSKAFLSTVQACTRVPAPAEASGVPPHSLSVSTLAIPLKAIRYFSLSISPTLTPSSCPGQAWG